MSLIDPNQLNRKGMRLFRGGYFQKAHDYFQAALERVNPEDQPALYFDINYNLAKTLQHRGEHSQAIKVFEALRMADARREIRYEHGIASSNYKLGDYRSAIEQFTRIMEKYRHWTKDFFYYDCKLGIAMCHAMQKEYGESLELLRTLIREDPDNSALYLKEVAHLKMALTDEMVFAGTGRQPMTEIKIEGDHKLCELLSSMIEKFPEIRLPIKAVYVEKQENNSAGLKKLGASNKFVPISQGHRDSAGHVLLYNKEFWREASDSALLGNLAHELMHRAWEDTGADRVFFSWTKDTLSYSCLERIIDLCVLAKGFVQELYDARKYIQQHSGSPDSIDLGLAELSSLLLSASKFEMAGAAFNLTKFELPESIADDIAASDVMPDNAR